MKNLGKIFIAVLMLVFLSCGGANESSKDNAELTTAMEQEDKIAAEVKESSETLKSDAEEAEKQIDALLKDI